MGRPVRARWVKAFGVPLVTVKRCVKRLREKGTGVFFRAAQRHGGSKLTPERLVQAQGLLDQGRSVPVISQELGVLKTTLHKAIDDGRLKQILKKRGEFGGGGPDQEPAE